MDSYLLTVAEHSYSHKGYHHTRWVVHDGAGFALASKLTLYEACDWIGAQWSRLYAWEPDWAAKHLP